MKTLSSKVRYTCPVFSVTEDEVEEPSGKTFKRCVVRHGKSAVIFPVDDEGRVLLVRQYRHPVEQAVWELPAGSVDDGESPLQAARRELREETGCRARQWRKLLAFYPSPGYVNEEMVIYQATGITHGEAEPMEDEDIESKWFAASEIEAGIRSGRFTDAKTLLAYWAYKERLGAPQKTAGGAA